MCEELIRNKITYKGANVHLATHYILASMTPERTKKEGIFHLILKRKNRKGRN